MSAPPVHPPLLGSKLQVPRRREGLVHRARLDGRLVGRDRPVLTLVSAPAGFGKTTLLTDWFSDQQDTTAWLSLDERDGDPARFLAYLVASVEAVVPGVGDRTSALLRSSPSAAESIVATLVNDLDAAGAEVTVVLDDYHLIGSSAVHELLALLLDHLPPHVRLVVASRVDPPLPLARLRARGELLEVRAADLRFTTQEAARYLADAMGLDLAPADVAALEARTEGWIAALQLAALSLRGRDDPSAFVAGFAGDDRFVVDYLVEEVLERQPAEVRDLLLETSVLGRLTGPLCDAVTGGTGGAALLEALDRANLFLVPLDDRRRWYRYHHLFGDVLRARLLDERPDEVPELHRRAARWWAATGDRSEAIGHALAAADWDHAAELIERAAAELRRSRQEATLRGWLETLPEDLFRDRPVLAMGLVGARMATGATQGVEALLDDVERWLDPADPDRSARAPIVFAEDEWAGLPAQAAVQRAGLALLAGDPDAAVAHAERVLDLAEPDDHLRRGAASALLGLAHWRVGDLDAARHRYGDVVAHFAEGGYVADELGCRLTLADIQLAQGRLGEARRTYELGLEHARDQPGLRGTADMHVGLAEVHVERDELDEAAGHLAASDDLGPAAGLPQHAHRWRAARARLLVARGEAGAAWPLLDEAERAYDTDFSPSVRPIPALRARLRIIAGDEAAGRTWARESGLGADDELDHLHEYEHVTLARTLLATDPAGAVALLDRLRVAAVDGRRAGSLIEVLVLLAVAHHAAGDRPAATAALDEALALTEPEGHLRVFAEAGATVAALLDDRAGGGVAPAWRDRILAACRGREQPPRHPAGLVDGLSSRELDVLRLLRSDLSGPDIARELLVSLNTLRTHTRNIYAKLGVNNRREAVRRATELGL